jgi:hypothetical protein
LLLFVYYLSTDTASQSRKFQEEHGLALLSTTAGTRKFLGFHHSLGCAGPNPGTRYFSAYPRLARSLFSLGFKAYLNPTIVNARKDTFKICVSPAIEKVHTHYNEQRKLRADGVFVDHSNKQ